MINYIKNLQKVLIDKNEYEYLVNIFTKYLHETNFESSL